MLDRPKKYRNCIWPWLSLRTCCTIFFYSGVLFTYNCIVTLCFCHFCHCREKGGWIRSLVTVGKGTLAWQLGLGNSRDTIHYRDSRAHYSNTIVSDYILFICWVIYGTWQKRVRVKCLCLRTNLNTFFVDSSVDQIEPLCKHSLPFSTDVWVSTFVLLHSNISAIFCTNLHRRQLQ